MGEALGFALFDTALGTCAAAWSARGLVAVQLPEGDAARTRAWMKRRHAAAREAPPPAEVARSLDRIVALLAGQAVDLSGVVLDDEDTPEFDRRVYAIARTIAPGATMTYGEIAARLGDPRLARDVGQALGRNPFTIVVPCHRVLAAGGRLGGFSARGGQATKKRLLLIEGARAGREPDLFDPPSPAA